MVSLVRLTYTYNWGQRFYAISGTVWCDVECSRNRLPDRPAAKATWDAPFHRDARFVAMRLEYGFQARSRMKNIIL